MNGAAIALLALALLALPVYSVAISLGSDNIARIGGTGQVNVLCPVSDCRITRVEWGLSGTPPRVNSVSITWTPAETSKYTVYAVVYDDGTMKAHGSKTETVTEGQSTTTTVTLGTTVDPAEIDKVEIIIVES